MVDLKLMKGNYGRPIFECYVDQGAGIAHFQKIKGAGIAENNIRLAITCLS